MEAPDPERRANAAENLGWLERVGEPAIPALIRHLNDSEKRVRQGAALALGNIGQQPDMVVPALLKTLKDEDLLLRTFSAGALSRFGNQATDAVPIIQAYLAEHPTNDFYNLRLREALKAFEHSQPLR